jgi:DNA primase
VYIAYDRDEAGDKAAAKLADELIEMGIECDGRQLEVPVNDKQNSRFNDN